jgi:hypothetical protein
MLRDADSTMFANYLVKPVSPERIAAAIEAELSRLGLQLP